MWTIVIDDPGVCQSVSVTQTGCAKTAKRINVLFALETPGTRLHCVRCGSVPRGEGDGFDAAFVKLLRLLVFLFIPFSSTCIVRAYGVRNVNVEMLSFCLSVGNYFQSTDYTCNSSYYNY